jgi:hypothetical protein
LVFRYLVEIKKQAAEEIAASLWRDYQRGGRSDKPHCLRPYLNELTSRERERDGDNRDEPDVPKRQARHQQKS